MRKSPYLTTKEVARLLQVHVIHVYRLVRAGKLHPVKFGRALRFERSEIEGLPARKHDGDGRRKR